MKKLKEVKARYENRIKQIKKAQEEEIVKEINKKIFSKIYFEKEG